MMARVSEETQILLLKRENGKFEPMTNLKEA